MKKEHSIHRGMLTRFLFAALIPVLIFAMVMQWNNRKTQMQTAENTIQRSLRNSDRGLDMMLDKYEAILDELRVEKEILDSVKEVKTGTDGAKASMEQLLRYICQRNDGLEGILLVFPDKSMISASMLSEENAAWAKQIPIPESGRETTYCGMKDPVILNGREQYLILLSEKLIDTQAGSQELGTIVFLLGEDYIRQSLDFDENSQVYILNGETVISAEDKSEIGLSSSQVLNDKHCVYTKKESDQTGFTFWNERSLETYYEQRRMELCFLGIVALASVMVAVVLAYSLSKPYLNAVDSYMDTISRVEKGDFSARSYTEEKIPKEFTRIGRGFNEMVVHIENLIEQVKQASAEQRMAELSALEAQIDPHFLYNTLDAINWKAIENEQYEISEMIGALADILRYAVKNAGAETSLEHALSWVDSYIMIQSAKLGKKPDLRIQVAEELKQIPIHKLLIQPFIENAMKYAFTEKSGQWEILIAARMTGDQLHILIEDNGKGIEDNRLRHLNEEEADMGTHVGIANVRKRLKLYYDEAATLYLESVQGSGTRVHLFIPVRKPDTKPDAKMDTKEGEHEDRSSRGRDGDQGRDGEYPAKDRSRV